MEIPRYEMAKSDYLFHHDVRKFWLSYKMTKIDHFLYRENTEIPCYEMAKIG